MEIQALPFFWFWAVVSIISLRLGFDALDSTHLSNSVPPVVLFFFKHALSISLCHSSHNAFVYVSLRSSKDVSMYLRFIPFALLGPLIYDAVNGPAMWCVFPIWGLVFFCSCYIKKFFSMTKFGEAIGCSIDFAIKLTMISFGDNNKFFPILVLLFGCYAASVWAVITEDRNSSGETVLVTAQDRVNENSASFSNMMRKLIEFGVSIMYGILLDDENSCTLKKILFERRKLIKFSIGMMLTILFQVFFQLKSFNQVLAFLYLTVAWLGNLALLRPNGDLGIFNFLLANVIIGCTVSEFRFRGPTWIAYCAALFLYGLRVKLQSLSLVDRRPNVSARVPSVVSLRQRNLTSALPSVVSLRQRNLTSALPSVVSLRPRNLTSSDIEAFLEEEITTALPSVVSLGPRGQNLTFSDIEAIPEEKITEHNKTVSKPCRFFLRGSGDLRCYPDDSMLSSGQASILCAQHSFHYHINRESGHLRSCIINTAVRRRPKTRIQKNYRTRIRKNYLAKTKYT